MEREKFFRILEAFLHLFSHLILKIKLSEAGLDMHKTLGLTPQLHIIRAWWCTRYPSTGEHEEGDHKLKVSFVHIASSRLAWATGDPASKQRNSKHFIQEI